jgi:hypothetical protein
VADPVARLIKDVDAIPHEPLMARISGELGLCLRLSRTAIGNG